MYNLCAKIRFMEEKLSLPYKQQIKSKSIKWTFNRRLAARAVFIGMTCFFISLSIQNDLMFLNEILVASGILALLLVGSAFKSKKVDKIQKS